MEQRDKHVPVLLERCLELLAPALAAPGAVHLDATVGLGGHAAGVLAAHPDATLVGLDRDPQALRLAAERLAEYSGRTHLVHAVYDELPEVLHELDIAAIQGALFDLGVSSMQLDEPARGFSYAQDAPLDMRMDPTRGRTAEEVVNTYSAADLARILRVYGEERFAPRIAAAIVRERTKAPLTSSARLAELVRDAIPAATRRTGGHPAKRTFQALRIEVNGELEALERALPAALDSLATGGRIVVLAYHSLEDRLVKRTLAARARSSAPVDLPVELPGTAPTLRLLTRGSEPASAQEVAANPRAASVRLRAAERIDSSGAGAGAAGSSGAAGSAGAGAGAAGSAGAVGPGPSGPVGAERPGRKPRPPRRPKAMHHPGALTANQRPGSRDGRPSSGQGADRPDAT